MSGASRYSDGFWASVLQWSRLGANAVVFLIVARFLTLEQIGAFATAAAPMRFFIVIHKSGIEETAVIRPRDAVWRDALSVLSIAAGLAIVCLSVVIAGVIGWTGLDGHGIGPMLAVLSLASLAHGFGAVPDGLLRRDGKFRVLALRALAAQVIAAAVTFGAVAAGAGPWSLVVFTLTNAVLTAAISMHAAYWTWPRRWPDRVVLADALQSVTSLSGRVLIGAVLQPVLQIGVGAIGGLAAAGAFQIALRMLALIEAVTLAPLRFLALPRFSRLQDDRAALGIAILVMLGTAGRMSGWIYLGVAAAAPDLLALLVGTANAAETATTLRILCLSGLYAAMAAVGNQALIAVSLGQAAIRLAIWNAVLSLGLAGPVLLATAVLPGLAPATAPAVAAAIVAAGLIVLLMMLAGMPRWFGIPAWSSLGAVALPFVAGAVMALTVIALTRWAWPEWPLLLRLGGQVLAGSAVYFALLHIGTGRPGRGLRRVTAG